MKLRICSDLHLEGYEYHDPASYRDYNTRMIIPYAETDKESVLVIAGDICYISYAKRHWRFFDDLSKRFLAVVIIAGNHEYWYGTYSPNKYKEFFSEWSNIHFLENDFVKIDDVVFWGMTLWTNLSNPIDEMVAQRGMVDYRKTMLENGTTMTASFTNFKHVESVWQFKEFLKAKNNEKLVVVTHHGPSFNSCSPKYKHSALNCAFYSNLDDLVAYSDAVVWIHGHTHDSHDYSIGNTRIICNPLGYNLGEENENYNPALVVEV